MAPKRGKGGGRGNRGFSQATKDKSLDCITRTEHDAELEDDIAFIVSAIRESREVGAYDPELVKTIKGVIRTRKKRFVQEKSKRETVAR